MEQISIKLYGVFTEIANSREIHLSVEKPVPVGELKSQLVQLYPAMKLVQMNVAVNNEFTDEGECTANDDVVLMPPFSGG